MSNESKSPIGYLHDHLVELAKLEASEVEGKRMVGLVTLVCYEDGKYYPHASGYIDHARALGILQTYLIGLTLNEHQQWCNKAISRSSLEGGL